MWCCMIIEATTLYLKCHGIDLLNYYQWHVNLEVVESNLTDPFHHGSNDED